MRAFLLAGQSNMAGRGAVEPQDRQPHPRVVALGKDGKWAPARDPLHWDKPEMAGVGPGLAFGKALAEALPNETIGLVPAAFGGTSMQQWQKDSTDSLRLYATAVERARTAMKDGRLAGILWHQGEGNATGDLSVYAQLFARLFADLRDELGNVPIIAGELGDFVKGSQRFNAALNDLPKLVADLRIASAAGLTHKGDNLHFDTASARELGTRYAKVYLQSSR